jgi:hypothetical protein
MCAIGYCTRNPVLAQSLMPSRSPQGSGTCLHRRDIIRESVRSSQVPCGRGAAQRKPHPGVSHGYPLPTVQRRGQSLVLLGHVRPALGVQVLDKGFDGTTERVLSLLNAVLFKRPQHAINIGCPSDIDGIFGQFIHGGKRACEPMSVGKIETIASGLKKSLTRFSTKAERHIIALRITTAARDRHTQKPKHWN